MSSIDEVANQLEGLGLRFRRESADCIRIGFADQNVSYEALILDQTPLITIVVPQLAIVPERRIPEMIAAVNELNASYVRWGTFWVHPRDHYLGFELGLPLSSDVTRPQVVCALA